MRLRIIAPLYVLLLMSVIFSTTFVVTPQEQYGPAIDKVRLEVVKSPDAQVIAMVTGEIDFLPDLVRTSDVELLDSLGFTVFQDQGFQVGYVGFNIRSDQSYRTDRPPGELPMVARVLSDVNFRHALIHGYDQLGIIPPIYGYTVTNSTSLVPPIHGPWLSTTVPQHPYNPGDPFTSPAGEHSSVGILKASGYVFVDTGSIGVVDPADYWTLDGVALPTLRLLTPLMSVVPTSYQHGAEIINDLSAIGLNNILVEAHNLSEYYAKVFQNAEFDMYMAMWGDDFEFPFPDGSWKSLGRFPDYLYEMMHSSQDSHLYPWRLNAPGINDPYVDALAETVKFGLGPEDLMTAAWDLQDYLYDSDLNPQAFPYIQLYSKNFMPAAAPHLRGLVKSPGYGADNKWTWLNWQWNPGFERIDFDGRTTIVYTLGDEPESLNPLSASSVPAWMILGSTLDSLTTVDPYLHEDLPWLAADWAITETAGGGMEISFTMRNDVTWQDGKPLTAYDIEWGLEFLRNYQVPRYASMWQTLVDVVVTDNTHLTIITSEAGLSLFYDLSGLAVMLPRHIWDRFGDYNNPANRQAVLDYDPSEAYNVAPGYTPGPTPTPTNLFGTGPYIFQFYDAINMYADVWANRNYFLTTTNIQSLLIEMFHKAGDVDRNGSINMVDMNLISFAYGTQFGDPNYNPDVDLNADGIIDAFDFIVILWHFGEQRTYSSVSGGDSLPMPEVSESLRFSEDGPQSLGTILATGVSSATVRVKPELIKNETLKPGSYFSVDINITNAFDFTGLKGFEFRLTFNASILHVDSIVAGDFLREPHVWKNQANNVAGFAWFAANSGPNQWYGSVGSGRLATVRFKVVGYNQTPLELKGMTKLANGRGRMVSHIAYDGYFDNRITGDVNLDGIVDILDLYRVGRPYGYSSGQPQFDVAADLNEDGTINADDLLLLVDNWGVDP